MGVHQQRKRLKLHPAFTAQLQPLSHRCSSAAPGSSTSNLLFTTKPQGGRWAKAEPGTREAS